jgi:tryptophan 2,3-dioxygenase
MEMTPEIKARLEKLQEKYAAMGQDMVSYLDGLLYADYLTYWDYIHLDTLLSLQTPKTPFPDEEIFILYHQITELYFKLVLHECKQIADKKDIDIPFLETRLKRMINYFEALTQSFSIMVEGMEKEQFLQFRMSLLPASGFQSGQYRMIEIYATDFINLVAKEKREHLKFGSLELQFQQIYWKFGATELASGKQTLTLKQFEQKYSASFLTLAQSVKETNLWQVFLGLKAKETDVTSLQNLLRRFDVLVNVNWPLAHYKSAVKYLNREPEEIKATGGTNWQKYLPPRFQKRIFYPELWSENEQLEWGKAWVAEVLQLPTQ